jgi:hypothetical protein
MSSIFGPTGVPILDRLGAFIDQHRRRMDARNGNLFAASAGAWWRYYVFLTHVLARYDRSNAAYVEVMEQVTRRMKEAPAGGGSRPMTPEDMAEVKRQVDLAAVLHLDIETFYLFAKILLDRIADTFGLMFGVDWKRTGSSYSDLSTRFEVLCTSKGLEIRPDNLPALISKLWKAIVDYRNKVIEHLGDAPVVRGTIFTPGKASGVVTSRMYPTEEDAEAFRQTEDPHALLRKLEEFIEAMLTFSEVNARKSPLIVA